MIVFEDLRKYVSIVGTEYRVLGLWSWTQKKLATKTMEKKNLKGIHLLIYKTYS
jgi:hypothetical protein